MADPRNIVIFNKETNLNATETFSINGTGDLVCSITGGTATVTIRALFNTDGVAPVPAGEFTESGVLSRNFSSFTRLEAEITAISGATVTLERNNN